jgi:hypothetical protein
MLGSNDTRLSFDELTFDRQLSLNKLALLSNSSLADLTFGID